MNPVPEAHDLRSVSPEFLPLDVARATDAPRPRPTLAASLAVQGGDPALGALLRFKSLMAAEGQSLHLARLCYDRLYAYERIAVAHARGNEALRRLALELFQIYHRQATQGLPAQ